MSDIYGKVNASEAFLSCDWGVPPTYVDYQRVVAINAKLRAAGVVTYLDDCLTNKNQKQIETRIDAAAVVVIFVTRKYMLEVVSHKMEDNVKFEFSYATRQKSANSLIVVVLEPLMRDSTRWQLEFAANIAGGPFIDFYTNGNDDDTSNCARLVEEIRWRKNCNRQLYAMSAFKARDAKLIRYKERRDRKKER
jgi:hypothetical protein